MTYVLIPEKKLVLKGRILQYRRTSGPVKRFGLHLTAKWFGLYLTVKRFASYC